MILATFTNAEDGMESRVISLRDGRISVTLRDMDADEILPSARIYPADRLADAKAHAATVNPETR